MSAAPASLRRLLTEQRRWAEARHIDLESPERVRDWRENLLWALPPEMEEALRRHTARPLGECGKPADLAWLHSRWSLLCNHFRPWVVGGVETLARACGAHADGAALEWGVACDRAADEVSVDALFTSAARPTAVVATFAEPYDEPEVRAQWNDDDRETPLDGCALLAADVRANGKRFRHAPLARVLAQADALTTRFGPRVFRLLYLWFDTDDEAARRHRQELDRLRMRIGGEVDFAALSWRALRARLCALESDTDRVAALAALDARYSG